MTNQEVIKAFLNEKNARTPLRKIIGTNGMTYYGRTLSTYTRDYNDILLINYDTVIAKIKDNTLYINTHKYSPTTSKIQHYIKYFATHKKYTIIECKDESELNDALVDM